MLSITGKGYSKIYSENPFFEEPQPKAFYHPSPLKQLSESEKQLALSPKRTSKQELQTELHDVEKKFLTGGHTIKPLTCVEKQACESPDSSKFDESWPDNERPFSPSYTSGEDKCRPFTSVRRHAQPAFTSNPAATANLTKNAAGDLPASQAAFQMASKSGGKHGKAIERPWLPGESEKTETNTGSGRDKNKETFVMSEKGSVLQRYIERFRHGPPMSREERCHKGEIQKQDFWWLESSHSTPNRASTPKEEGRILPVTFQKSESLTTDNLRKLDDLDRATDHLQEKAEKLLQSAQSVGSSELVVSTEGLGSTGSDVTGSSFSEPEVRPSFPLRDNIFYPSTDRQVMVDQPGRSLPQDDILYKWRLQRKLEVAREGCSVPLRSAKSTAPKMAAEGKVYSRLAAFKEKLQQHGSMVMVSSQLQEATLSRALKQVQRVMDTGVQTSPVSDQALLASFPAWSFTKKVNTAAQVDSQEFPSDPSGLDSPTHPRDKEMSDYTYAQQTNAVKKVLASEKFLKARPSSADVHFDNSKEAFPIKHSPGSSEGESEMPYRQFLEAERPHDGSHSKVQHISSQESHIHAAMSSYSPSSTADGGDQKGLVLLKCSQPVPQEARQTGKSVDLLDCSGDASPARFSGSEQPHHNNRSVLSDSSAAGPQAEMGNRKSQKMMGMREAPGSRRSSGQENVALNQNNSAVLNTGNLTRKCGSKSMKVRLDGSQRRTTQRLGAERLERTGVISPPQHSSSPARVPLSSAIEQVVHDRLFDLSGSVGSSVDSLSSLQHSIHSPQITRPPASSAESESDGEFESDQLLQLLRQQRQQHEANLRCLDSILAERGVS